ncbi:Hypothetical protein SRAE_1000126300 [Strongyloides ratti]|uniref:Uncharacterized protein n=1 Tax=Strongyloides ratti TaxID=34506 RepID=A0A090L4E9_STRRB|nr:Hypothetical protein SRAE_1000126300 [Strongyloides ratti]CEF62997.1 Hypothetical protein SRAE_1000126300 [Strongyloides ratti]
MMVESLDTLTSNELNLIPQISNIIDQIKVLKNDCKYEHLLSIYEIIDIFFSNLYKSNISMEFLEYIELVTKFLSTPIDIRLIVVKLLLKKPTKYPGRIFNKDELQILSQNSNNINEFINIVSREKISLHFMISNTFRHERIEYQMGITGKEVKKCSVENLMDTVAKIIKQNKLRGVYRINFSFYKMFSSMVIFIYSNNISRLTLEHHNIIEFYVNKKLKYMVMPNIELLEESKLKLFTDIVMLYFSIINSNHIVTNNDKFSTYTLSEASKNYKLLMVDKSFNKFTKENFQNSPHFILFKCMKFMAGSFASFSRFDIAKELFEPIISTVFFTKIPDFLQYGFLYDYCKLLKKLGERKKILEISQKLCERLKQLPLYYAVVFYKLYSEQKTLKKNESIKFFGDHFLPILEGTIEGTSKGNVKSLEQLRGIILKDLKKFINCSKGGILNKNLWEEVCLILIFNHLSIEEIHSFFYTEHFPLFSKEKMRSLVEKSCKLLLNLKSQKNYAIISSNHDQYSKFVKEQEYGNVNFVKVYGVYVKESFSRIESRIYLFMGFK